MFISNLDCRNVASGLACVAALASVPCALADTVFVQPGADTSLIEVVPDANLGGADFFNAGTAGSSGGRNRALLWFDVASQIPVGALIESVSLTLEIVRQPSASWEASVFGLHRVNVPWGEGNKIPEDGSPGLGAPATPGEATWLYRFLGGEAWAAPGGESGSDFVASPSAAALVFGLGEPVVFEGTPELVADVQAWVNDPDRNFGWMFMTESEEVQRTARSFASRESGAGGPLLMIQYTVVPEPGTGAVLLVGACLALAWARRKRAGR